jgi:hypothetical protein
MRAAGLGVVAWLLASTAAADPRLELTHEPPPRHLRMRPRAAVLPSQIPAARAPTPMPAAPPPLRAGDAIEQVTALRDIHQPVSFSLDLGYQVEEANLTGKATLDARAPEPNKAFDVLRSYGFGEAFASTRGVGISSLETYFAARFQITRQLTTTTPTGETVPLAPPIATWFERTGVELRTGWAEVRDFLPKRWGLSKLRVRAGGQYIYGPWVLHLDGVTAAYDGKILTASIYSGVRHSDYTRRQSDQRPGVFGASTRVDLRGLPTPIPIALQGEYLALGASNPSTSPAYQPSSVSTMVQADWRPRRDVAVIGQIRAIDGKMASQRAEIRARYGQVTNVLLDIMHRDEDDWRWDPSLVLPDADPTASRRYLDLGPVVPQLISSLRAGTLIAENVDLLVRGAVALDRTSAPGAITSSFSAPYVELGGAVEMRLRRTFALGGSLLTRQTQREKLPEPVADVRGVIQMLPASSALQGEEGFTEIGTSARMTLGARRFSALVEVYGRRTRYPALYSDPILPVPATDLRGGGRFTVDAWVGQQVRLFAAFDVSSAFDFAPEITGYKSLRLMMSGVY